jgi:hypothetical protein
MTASTRQARLAAAVGLLFVALAPLLIPLAILSPNFVIVRRVELTLASTPSGVFATERRFGLFGTTAQHGYGPILAAYPDFIRTVQNAGEPQRNEVLSVIALRAPDGVHRPFSELNTSSQPVALKAVTADVSAMTGEIGQFLQHEPAMPLTIVRSQPYPGFLLIYDAGGMLLALAVARYWTFSLSRAALLRVRGAPPQRAAAPILDIVERIIALSAWLSKQPR